MSKILAIDFGLKRCGLAISDDTKTFAFGLDTIQSTSLMSMLKVVCVQEKIDTVIIGLPMRMDGTDSHITENVKLFKEDLEKEIPEIHVELYDERFTSKLATQAMHMSGASRKQKQQKELVDKVSATILLQSYISSKQH